MKQYLPLLQACPLFGRMSADEMLRMLTCLRAQVVSFRQNQAILHQGDPAGWLGVVLSGCVQIVASDEYGNHSVIAVAHKTEVFAESFACAGLEALPVSVVAIQDSIVLLLEHQRVITGCRNGCMAHSYLVTNLMHEIARKNLMLNQKLRIVTGRTTQEKLFAYLSSQHRQAGTRRFVIPLDRQGLADYLGVERSAMSAELSKMKKAGLIDYRKNEFEILLPPDGHMEERHG